MQDLTRANIEDKLVSCFLQQWGSETPVVQENELPKWLNSEKEAAKVSEWVRISVLMTASAQDSFGGVGNRRMQRTGRVFVQCFVKSGIKTSRLNELSTKVVNIYENAALSPLRVLEITEGKIAEGASTSVGTASPKTDGVWYGKLVNVLFQFDEIK